ncbi:MAG TPA: SDR family NAD(P)-dependent oxidoreductase [Bryobacteraceae bacterium]|jgi:short-subunit dehydrogenase|nr:SDR family NAD(P)-dependent oxidoreductase [Bryobacteraceae bacterium]
METQNGTPFAVITGASSGIGYELANQFARHGFDILVVAEDARLEDAKRRLSEQNAKVESLRVDLATHDGVETLNRQIQSSGRFIDAVAINAGVGVQGAFWETSLDAQLNLIALNVTSAVHLTHRILPGMVARNHGRILYTSSVAATAPGPFMSSYNASKAFLKSFAEGIRNELKDTNVTVTTLMPGATETDFFRRAGMEDTKLGVSEKDDPADVAREGFEALMEGKDHIVAGSFKNKVQATLAHVLPDTLTAEMHRKQSEPGSAER